MRNRFIAIFIALLMPIMHFTAFAEADAVNVALNMQAFASSELSNEHGADKANDGINDNESYTCYISGENDEMPWWQVDLGLSYPVSKIEIEAKKGSEDGAQLNNLRILGANKQDFTDAVILAEIQENPGEMFSADFPSRQKIRYVKLEKTVSSSLEIGEIKIFSQKNEILYGAEQITNGEASSQIMDFEGTSTKFADITGTLFEEAVYVLSSLSIINGYPDGTFRPDNTITRAEFTKVASILLGIEIKAASQTFIDVPKTHWAYQYIETLAATGMIDGVGNRKFAPEDTITFNQAIKILVSLLGYKDIAEYEGGYPDGYLKIANKIKLLSGVKTTGENITRGQIAIMVKNAIELDVFQQTAFGDVSSGKTIQGETLLSQNLSICKGEGIVDAVRSTSLTNVNHDRDNTYITINGTEYTMNIESPDDFLGVYVEFWYYTGAGKPYEILCMLPGDSNKIVEISASDIISASSDKVEYYNGEKKKTLKISPSADVIYNGFALRDYTQGDLNPSDGSIKLIDNNSDNVYDVYMVNKIDTYIADRVNVNKNAISVKNNARLFEFKENDDIVTFIHAATGVESQISDIKEWDILTITESYTENGSKYYSILISDKFVEGVLETIGDDYVIIDNEEYKLVPDIDFSEVQPGDEGIFYIDAYGRVAAYNGVSNQEGEYGFLRAMQETTGLSGKVQFRIYTSNGSFVTLDAHGEKLKIDGIAYTDYDSCVQRLKLNGYASGSVSQPIKYIKDSRDRVLSIDTVYVGNETADSFGCDSAASSRYWKNTGVTTVVSTGLDQYAVGTDTVMFRIPADIDDEDDYEIVSTASLSSDTRYNMAIYDSSDAKIAGLVLFDSNSSDYIVGNRLMLVEKVRKVLNDNGDIVARVDGLYNGKAVSFMERESGIIDETGLNCGDVITVSLTAGNLINAYEKKWYPNGKTNDAAAKSVSPDEPYNSTAGTNDTFCLLYGLVLTEQDNIITIGPEDSFDYEPVVVSLISPELKMYRYDSKDKKVYIASPSDIFDAAGVGEVNASKVIVRISSRLERELIILD